MAPAIRGLRCRRRRRRRDGARPAELLQEAIALVQRRAAALRRGTEQAASKAADAAAPPPSATPHERMGSGPAGRPTVHVTESKVREDGTKQMSYAAMLALGSDDAAATRTPPDELRRRFEAQAAREAENYRAQRLEREAQHAAAAAKMRDIAASINAKVDERMQRRRRRSARPSRMRAPQPGVPHRKGRRSSPPCKRRRAPPAWRRAPTRRCRSRRRRRANRARMCVREQVLVQRLYNDPSGGRSRWRS